MPQPTASPCSKDLVACGLLDGVADGVAEIQNHAQAVLALIAIDHSRLSCGWMRR